MTIFVTLINTHCMLQNFNARTVDATPLNDVVDKPFADSGFIEMEEIWKDVVGYEGLYQVSNLGNVRSLKRNKGNRTYGGKTLKPIDRGNKYLCVSLSKVGTKTILVSVHTLVAKAFIQNKYNLPQVNHIDGNKQNNSVYNLEWANASMQAIHAFGLGLRNQAMGADDTNSKTVYQYTLDGKLVKIWGSTMEAERAGYCSNTISAVCRKFKSNKTHKGFIWRYSNEQI